MSGMEIRCPWCGGKIKLKPNIFKSLDGEREFDWILLDCEHCGKTMRVWRDGETERVIAIWDNYIVTG